ncbi:MAG: hypothetical protein ACOX5R_14875 [bacterium]|jgi:hypothetical protein
MIRADDLVCNVITNHPEAFTVFERHGMCEDCKMDPPPVSISHFANKHCEGRIEDFLRELNEQVLRK